MRANHLTWSLETVMLILAQTLTGSLASAQVPGTRSFTVDAAPWDLLLPDGGLTVAEERHKDDGRSGYIRLNGRSGLVVSAFIEPVNKCGDAKACRDMIWRLGNPSWEDPKNVRMSEIGDASCVSFLVPTFQGKKVDQQNLYAEFVKDGFWVDLHVSYAGFTPDRQVILDSFVGSVRLASKLPSRSPIQGSQAGRGFPVPGHGRFLIETPPSWRVQTRQMADPPSTYLVIGPPSGDSFSLQITAVWLDQEKISKTLADLRSRTMELAQEPLKQAVEKAVTLRDLQGPETKGYAFSVTDKAPPAGEYKYMTQSLTVTGELMVMTTFLHHAAPSADLEAALAALSSARHDRQR